MSILGNAILKLMVKWTALVFFVLGEPILQIANATWVQYGAERVSQDPFWIRVSSSFPRTLTMALCYYLLPDFSSLLCLQFIQSHNSTMRSDQNADPLQLKLDETGISNLEVRTLQNIIQTFPMPSLQKSFNLVTIAIITGTHRIRIWKP